MKKVRFFGLLMALLIAVSAFCPAMAAPEGGRQATILFTHDMHSHLMSATDESGASYGGYAKLKTVIDGQKALHPDALLVDGGDIAMGTLFQTAFSTDATELRIMGATGYDVTTFGNHEYDYRAQGLADMLNAALDSGEPLPQIVEANYFPPLQGQEGYGADSQAVWDAFERYGVKEYTVIERGGVNFAVFGIFGHDADDCAPMSGMILQDPVETAKEVVAKIQAEVDGPRVIVCLSHSGTTDNPKTSEDEILAEKVDGIDVIVSGHTHTTLDQPIKVNDTYIVSCGEYSKNLGVITLDMSGDSLTLADYELIAIDSSVAEDKELAERIDGYKDLVAESYLSQFGYTDYDQVIGYNPYEFDSLSQLNEHKEATLGNLIADSYLWAVQQAEGDSYVPVDFALTANGVIRESFAVGDITVSDVFNVSSLGIGADGVPGYPLISVYITGEDLKNAFEVDASVTSIMSAAQLYFTGMTFEYNPNRMIFNKVTDCAQVLPDGTLAEIENDKLYRVVTGLYCGQMLGAVEGKTFGILNIAPRDANGNEIDTADLESYIIHDQNGREIKEWYALASYIEDMGTMDQRYAGPEGRKVAQPSWNPVKLLKGANFITLIVLAVIIILIVVIVLIIRAVVRKVRKKKRK
ncbi:MAG: bifunctional metallophosphatase/5'-nucleotidase [Oscillospiraceae bacterium]|nr:bifunctional metallophosphatase/5'-nucleotidase [Oscillospiraceae bacterium]